MQNKSQLTNTNETWNAKKRYKINAVVTHLGNIYQNVTGINSEPGDGSDWYLFNPLGISGTDDILNESSVAGINTTDALNTLKASIPESYTKIVYVNATNPNSATIFDLDNPPLVNDNLLKDDVNNLYVGLNASTWVYKSTSLTYITEPITSGTSNFYLGGTLIDAGGNKITAIERTGTVGGAPGTLLHHFVTKAQHDLKENSSNKTGTVTGNEASTSLYLHIAGMIAYFQKKDSQIEISANSNVLNTWNGQTILFTANCTITVPATLLPHLGFVFRTLAGVTVTWAITSPFYWETTPSTTPEKTTGSFMIRGNANTILLDF